MKFYQMQCNDVIRHFHSNMHVGLSQQQVEDHRTQYGANTLNIKQRTILSIFISQFQSPLIYILFCAAFLIFLLSPDQLDAFIISGVLIFNAVLGTIQETRTSGILKNLSSFVVTEAVVLRDGKKSIVPDKELVVGDIIFVSEGQRIPADARLIEAHGLSVDESVLTGESYAVNKTIDPLPHAVAHTDQTNMFFRGTYSVKGTGKAIITAVGAHTEVGHMYHVAEEIKTDTPLTKELDDLVHLILLFIIGFCAFLFLIGYAVGKDISELFVILTALFICVVPEGLPVVLTLVMTTGAHCMSKQRVLVKNMRAIDAFGRINLLMVDKTGTLTLNEMMVSTVYCNGSFYDVTGQGYHSEGVIMYNNNPLTKMDADDPLKKMIIGANLLNNSEIIYDNQHDSFTIKGDRTEAAMYIFSKKMNLIDDIQHYKKVAEIPFDSNTHYHAAIFEHDDHYVTFIAGAPEVIISRCNIMSDNDVAAFNQLLKQGIRVIALGTKYTQKNETYTADITNTLFTHEVHFLGFFGIEDSIRAEAHDTIERIRSAGIKVIMATGDHTQTALYVGAKVGIYNNGDRIIDGQELAELSDAQLSTCIEKATLFSRMTALQKLRIVRTLQNMHYVVAMTGDGINDTPSLAAADLGIAMGSIGTDVAKQASDIILLQDSLPALIDAIEHGRHVFYTLRRVILYFFSTNMAEVLIVLCGLLVGYVADMEIPLPLTAVHILWLNLITDGFLDTGLSMEPKEHGLLSQEWLARKPSLIDKSLVFTMVYMALPMALGSLAIFIYYASHDLMYARTMALMTMVMYQWFNALNCRSLEHSLFSLHVLGNKWLICAMSFVGVLQCALLYIPYMNYLFKTVPLDSKSWLIILIITCPIIAFDEVRKYIIRVSRDD